MKKIPVIGMMSGTSMDGIDATLVLTDGIDIERTGISASRKYSDDTTSMLSKAITNPMDYEKNQFLSNLITFDHFNTVRDLLKKTSIKPNLIGFHGQTILHNPQKKISIQIGNPQLLCDLTKTNVIYNFRKNDLFHNGQGAPLAPIYHLTIMKEKNIQSPCCIINIGGVSNLTYWDKNKLIGFDCGPGNGLMDMFVQETLNVNFDKFGNIASKGNISKFHLEHFMNNRYFRLKYPKSLDRKSFQKDYNSIKDSNLSVEDKLATFAQITVESIKKSLLLLPKYPIHIIICGGGQYNKYLIRKLSSDLVSFVQTIDKIQLKGNLIEAELIAFLACRSLNNLPLTFPLTTGVQKPISGGELYFIE